MGKITNKHSHTLSESERRFQVLVENLNGMVYRCKNDPQWTMEYVSAYAEALTGYPASDLINNQRKAYADLMHPDDRDKIWTDIQEILQQKKSFVLTYRIHTLAGEEKWVWEQGRGVFSDSGDLLALEGFITDITESRRKQEELVRTQEFLEKTLASLSDALLVIDSSTKTVVACNQAVENVFGYSKPELLGSDTLILHIDGAHYSRFNRKIESLGELPSVYRTEYRMRRKDGSTIDTENSVSVIRDDSGKRLYSVILIRDLAEKKQAEQQRIMLQDQLNQAQKLEAVGRLAGGIAHDFNNLLAIMLGYGDILLDELDPESPHHQFVSDIQEAGTKASKLTRQLLAFGRKQSLEMKTLDINQLIRDFQSFLKRAVGENIALECSLTSEPLFVTADSSQLEQVLMNLAINARDAMPDGGKITIGSEYIVAGELLSSVKQHKLEPGDYVKVSFKDTGHGMNRQTMRQIFEPFFSTKSHESSSGLGLATTFGIVKQHGGDITVSSTPGKGTVFEILLPVSAKGARSDDAPGEKSEVSGGSGTVLIAEDEPDVLKLVRNIMKSNGYDVVAAGDAEEILSAAREYDTHIDLLLTDVVMPVMKGPALYKEILEYHPETKVLYMSGYASEAVTGGDASFEPEHFIQKPFNVKSLLQKVAGIIGNT